MEKIGTDAIRVRRVVVVRRIAVAVDIEEVGRVVRIGRTLPPIVANDTDAHHPGFTEMNCGWRTALFWKNVS